ncbi:MAG TPA: helix-turn-helix domain-containing protein [Conexibacter sp.]|jgi:hypothetical protein
MPDIGSTLREARMRARIDITEVEQATKIRAKYLRAIENEEWDLLPGSTFVKSFIREYANFLGIDSRPLVEEFKLRYERPSESELRTVSPGLSRDRGRSSRGGGRGGGGGGGFGGGRVAPRWAITLGLVALLVIALFAVGKLGGGSDDGGSSKTTAAQARANVARRGAGHHRGVQAAHRQQQATPPPPTLAGVRIVPTADLYVCLVDQDGRAMIPGTTFTDGQSIPLQHARSMRLTLGNSSVQLRVNGRAVTVPDSPTAVGFAITTRGATPISGDQLPTCAA